MITSLTGFLSAPSNADTDLRDLLFYSGGASEEKTSQPLSPWSVLRLPHATYPGAVLSAASPQFTAFTYSPLGLDKDRRDVINTAVTVSLPA